MDTDLEVQNPNEIRRHAKKMHTALEYNQRYRRLGYYKPNARQLLFHNAVATELALRAGNQLGKTTAAASQLAMDATQIYPTWYEGRKFLVKPPIERPHEFVGWAASTTSVATRDGLQTKICGDIRQSDGLGQGMVPLDNIIGVARSRGIDAFVDTLTIRRESGGTAIVQFKTYEQGSSQFQGSAVDEILLDEDYGFGPGVDIWKHCLARFQATSGRLIWTATPIPGLGRTPWRKRFSEESDPDRQEIVMGIDEVDHISEIDKEKIKLRWANDPNRNLVLYGADATGGGSVFEFPHEAIMHTRDASSFPSWFRWAWSFDFSHGGASESARPFAAVLCCHDPDPANDIIYVVKCIRLRKMLAVQHIARILEHPMWDAPVLWSHDGQRGDQSGGTLADIYKRGGLNMQPSWTTFKDGGYSFQGGIAAMEERFSKGKLLFPKWEPDLWAEYDQYHTDQNGLIVKIDDDLLSAIRGSAMGVRHFRQMDPKSNGGFARHGDNGAALNSAEAIRERNDFNVFTGE